MQQHRVIFIVHDGDSVSSPEEIDIVKSVLRDFGLREAENSTHKPPRQYLSLVGGPITSHASCWITSSIVPKRDDKRASRSWGKADAGNLISACFNIERYNWCVAEFRFEVGIHILQGRLDVNGALGAPDFREGAFAARFREV